MRQIKGTWLVSQEKSLVLNPGLATIQHIVINLSAAIHMKG